MPEEPTDAHNMNVNPLADFMFPMTTEAEIDPMQRAPQLLDFSNLGSTNSTNSNSSNSSVAMMPGNFSATRTEYPNPEAWVLDSFLGVNYNTEGVDMAPLWGLNFEGQCTCHIGVTELLAAPRGGGISNDQRLSLDAQLAKLKQCIVSSETSMGCPHGREDTEPTHIMAVAMLISNVIDDFRMLATESPPPSRSSSMIPSRQSMAEMATMANTDRNGNSIQSRVSTPTSFQTSSLIEPRLSWGVLELEEDDEMELRQRLYLLSFRKLERLLSRLTLYLQDLHNAWSCLPDPSRHTAFVVACESTRLWLEKKAIDVKRMFSVPMRDETMDSSLG